MVKPNQHPFEFRGKVEQLQTLAALDRLRVASSGTVLSQSVRVDQNQGSLVAPFGVGVPPAALDGEFDNGTGIPAAGDDDIEMQVEALFVA